MVFGPAAGVVLSDFGADVIKIEPPVTGDLNRNWHKIPGLPISEIPYAFQMTNRNKRSLVLNLKDNDAHEALCKLVKQADIFITNYRLDAVSRLRIDYETMKAINPKLIYALATGYGEKGKEKDKGWTCDLIPKELVVHRFLSQEHQALQDFEADLESHESELTSIEEEYGGEEAPLNEVTKIGEAKENLIEYSELAYDAHYPEQYSEREDIVKQIDDATVDLKELENQSLFDAVKNAKGKITQKAIKDRIKTLGDHDFESIKLNEWITKSKGLATLKKELKTTTTFLDDKIQSQITNNETGEYLEDIKVLNSYINLHQRIAGEKKGLKIKVAELDNATLNQFKKLTEEDVRTLVVDDKWLASLKSVIQSEIDAISQRLTGRVKELAERYENTMGELNHQTSSLEEKVKNHLKKMQLEWS